MSDRWFLRLYPRAWRERYGDELAVVGANALLRLDLDGLARGRAAGLG